MTARYIGEAPDIFGHVCPVESANRRPDLRNVETFAEALERELRITAEIQANPFKHLHPPLPALSTVLRQAQRALDRDWPGRQMWRPSHA